MNFMAFTKPKVEVRAVVKRADGRTFDLGTINGWFPWRAWAYRVRFWIEELTGR